MRCFRPAFISLSLCAAAAAAERSGKATAEWLAESATCPPGQSVETALRLVLDPGWHTYWENPGEAGMKTSVKWALPPAWSASPPAFPVPIRFKSGSLTGFGYEDRVDLPVTLTAPQDFSGTAELKATISWLTCDDSGCVPGNATLTLTLTAGPPAAGPASAAVAEARRKIPQPLGSLLEPQVSPDQRLVTLRAAALPAGIDLSATEAFPATPDTLAPAAPIRFSHTPAEGWAARVPLAEYAALPLKQLTLVFPASGGHPPFSLSWPGPP